MRVAVLDDIHDAFEGTDGVRRLREHAEVKIFTGPFGTPDKLAGFDALIANRERTRFTRELFAALPDLRIIAQTGNHVYHIDLAAAADHRVIIAKATGGYSIGAAELAIALAMSLMRQIPKLSREMAEGTWSLPMTQVLWRKTIGIVGLGHVGTHLAGIAKAFGMRVLAWGPRLTDERATAAGAERRELDDLLRESDIVSIHATLGAESRGLIDAHRLGLMKPATYLINTARGPIVEEGALIAALRDGRIAGAGLDVFDQEPLPTDHPLRALPNVILTPHIGWPTDHAYAAFADAAADALLAWADGKPVAQFTADH